MQQITLVDGPGRLEDNVFIGSAAVLLCRGAAHPVIRSLG
jgi:hypothetical protein